MDEVTQRMCVVCGAPLPGDARFCPRCGAAIERREKPRETEGVEFEPPTVVPAVVPPPPRRSSKPWLIGVPIAIVILVGVIWALVAGMPFGAKQQVRRTAPPPMDTIAEGTSTAATGSIGDTNDMRSEPPPMTSAVPPPPTQPAQTEIQETEARGILARFLDARDPYHTPANCLDIRGTGYNNRGYGFDVMNSCESRRLGSWRVDSVTRELFEQKPDGRYLSP